VLDLRVSGPHVTADQKVWKLGQDHYEIWLENIGSRNQDQDYESEYKVDKAVYDELDISGRVLDIGGGDGRLRAFVDKSQYICCDPFLSVDGVNHTNEKLLEVYLY
jgi:hypothetical protein